MGKLNIMKQARQMAEKMEKMREELAARVVEASSGGGMVNVQANGDNKIIAVKIDREVIDPEDSEMLEDLIVSAVNEALRRVQEMQAEGMAQITGGLNIPGLM